MPNWVKPEWLPCVPQNDHGPFFCYVLWVAETRQYYVGHTGDLEARLRKHFSDGVKTTSGYRLKLLWLSGPMATRSSTRHFEAALKNYVLQRKSGEFKRNTGLYLAQGATLLDASP